MAAKKETKKQFRPAMFIQNIHQVEERDPNYEYRNVIFTYRTDPNRVQRFLDQGWEVVESTEQLQDDRDFTPNSKDEKLRPQPIITRTKCGNEQVLLRCLKTRREENELKKKKARDDAQLNALRQRGANVTQRGGETIVTDAEINENNI